MKILSSWEARTLVIYLFDLCVWTPFVFYILYPWFGPMLIGASHSPWWSVTVNFLLQSCAALLVPTLMSVFVAKPLQMKPLINTKKKARKSVVLIASGIMFLLLTPPSLLGTPQIILGTKLFVTGMAEEWQFRGIMTRVFQKRLGLIKSIVLVSLLFGVFHWGEIFLYEREPFFSTSTWIQMGSDIFAGLLLSWIVWRSGSLFWGAFVHGLADWQPWTLASGRPWVSDGIVAIILGIIGAELIRVFGVDRHSDGSVEQ